MPATGAGLVADQAADRKADKYADFTAYYVFEPIAVETYLGSLNASALELISNLARELVTFLATIERPSFYSSLSP